MARLYIVSTPIGNLSDLSKRAADTLEQVGCVFAEDTRRTRRLLDHVGIRTRVVSLHRHNEAARASQIAAWLAGDRDAAVVADAGTPLVSDPGARAVARALAEGHQVVPIPGPSAVLSALVGSGLPAERFTFLGFVPRKGQDRHRLLGRVKDARETTIVFEAANRLPRLLTDLEAACGPARGVAVAREMTKLHEEFVRGTVAEIRAYYEEHPARGEVTLVIAADPEEGKARAVTEARALAGAMIAVGARPSEAARQLAKRLGLPRNLCYRVALAAQAQDSPAGRDRSR